MDRKTRNSKKLGGLLGDYEDMKRRIQQSNAEMNFTTKLWLGTSPLPLKLRCIS